MRIGVDFDNTIVCYDALFHRVCRERNLIPAGVPVNKSDVRNYLRRIGQEDAWTEIQGYVYGARMNEAEAYPGAVDFFRAARGAGGELCIISHKTRHPFRGPQYDLHQAALGWLEFNGFFDPARIGLPREAVFLELTKAEKLARISECGCTHFIDDLPELLTDPAFPAGVQRVLFDPNDLYPNERAYIRVKSWSEARERLLGSAPEPAPVTNEVRGILLPFLRGQGFGEQCTIAALRGGANNRVYRVGEGGRTGAIKQYFQNGADSRDRFGVERAFYEFAWGNGIRRTPEPLAWSAESRIGLFSFVPGRKLNPVEVDRLAVGQSLEFITELNSFRATGLAAAMPTASEACFAIREHLECVERRVARLRAMEVQSDTDREAGRFVHDELDPVWRQISQSVADGAVRAGMDPDRVLAPQERCVSPSDFGFHNALLTGEGKLAFFDFEYAGWDDPAKLACDFFCQPELPVERKYWEEFVGTMARGLALDAAFIERARLLLPVYQLKWCGIMLNEFIRRDAERRQFAGGGSEERKQSQLARARRALPKAMGG
jgi:FMN phosphatase YigB (HAD superfamily)